MLRIRAAPRLVIAALVVGAGATPAFAAQSCSGALLSLAFGTYDRTSGTPRDVQGTLTINCTTMDTYTFQLGTGGSGTYFPRKMASGANRLDYNIYTLFNRTVIFGDGTD